MGCRLLDPTLNEGEQPEFFGAQIEECTGIGHGIIYPFLGTLAEASIITPHEERPGTENQGQGRRTLYTSANTEIGQAFNDTLELPEICPMRRFISRKAEDSNTERPPQSQGILAYGLRAEIGQKAEAFLLGLGLVQRPTSNRRRMLGCLGCHLLRASSSSGESEVCAAQINQCTKITNHSISYLLRVLAKAGLLVGPKEKITEHNGNLRPRNYYTLADTEAGQAFAQALEIPSGCSNWKTA